jgi:L-ribulokinase
VGVREGAYPDLYAASAVMGTVERAVCVADERRAAAYDRLYEIYTELHGGGTGALHTLWRIRNAAADRSVLGGDGAHDAAPEGDGRRP